jgi:hypothetical protein
MGSHISFVLSVEVFAVFVQDQVVMGELSFLTTGLRVQLNSQTFTQHTLGTGLVPQHHSERRKLAVEMTEYVLNVPSTEV